MPATIHDITSRTRREPPEPARFTHFELSGARPADAHAILADLRWSLYAADGPRREVMFVELPEKAVLSNAPFVYMAQYEKAGRAMIVPIDELPALAEQFAAPEKLIFVFSMGRCGSTLVARILDRCDGVLSLSEPDLYTGLVMDRESYQPGDVDILISAGTRLLFRPQSNRKSHILAIKLRSQVLFQAAAFQRNFADASYVFLHRDPVGWAKSFHHFIHSLGISSVLDSDAQKYSWMMTSGNGDTAYLKPFFDFPATEMDFYKILAPAWMRYMETFLDLEKAGMIFHPIRYDHFKKAIDREADALLDFCGLTIADPSTLRPVFDRHAQKGSFLDVEKGEDHFTPHRKQFTDLLRCSPRFSEVEAFAVSDGIPLD